jgi:hypothetical protein
VKLTALQSLFEITNQSDRAVTVTNLKKTIISAATVISSGATNIDDVVQLDDLASDFGDWFRSETSAATLNWIYSDTREEPLFSLDIQRLNSHSALNLPYNGERTLPIHGTSRSTPVLAVPTVSIERVEVGTPEENSTEQTGGDNASGAALKQVAKPDNESKLQLQEAKKEDNDLEQKSPKSKRKRWSWFRPSKSNGSIKIRDPVMFDPKYKSAKKSIPRRLKLVFVGDGATGKTCLLM